jgi:peptidoglycan L-alanyl-D-glutamate endopeptidase CwlK
MDAYNAGRSKAKFGESLHNSMPSDAVDIVPYPVVWDNKESFIESAGFVMGVAAMLGIDISWGGHFKNFFDGPHYERDV